MERIQLGVEAREGTGKSVTRKMRAKDAVPAVLYGGGMAAVSLTVPRREAERALLAGANRLIDLSGIPAVKGKLALIKEYQRNPVSRELLHCDFYAVDTSKPLQVLIPVHITGRPHGVELGGVLEQLLREISVSCLPLAIPDSVSIDVSALEIGQTLHVSDLALPEGVALLTDAHLSLVHVIAARLEAEPAAAAEPAAEAAAPAAESDD
jgi:large subunit ribosomal protein L25